MGTGSTPGGMNTKIHWRNFGSITRSFYDKAQQHYKNKDMKMQLIQEFIQQNREDWEKIYSPPANW